MNIAWKIGVKRKASRLTGSAPGGEGWSGCWGVPLGVGDAPEAPGDALLLGKHAATSKGSRNRSSGPAHSRASATSCADRLAGLADGVIATRAPGVAAGDPAEPHPAAAQE